MTEKTYTVKTVVTFRDTVVARDKNQAIAKAHSVKTHQFETANNIESTVIKE